MGINRWIESVSPNTLETILVDILVADGATFSGYINSVALVEDPECILLTSRPPKEGLFVGKKILKKEIIGFNFSVTPRANFGVHQIRLAEIGTDLQFQHAIHDQQHFLLSNKVEAKNKFVDECMSYLKKLSAEFVMNEKITLILNRGTTNKFNVDTQGLDSKVREFLLA